MNMCVKLTPGNFFGRKQFQLKLDNHIITISDYDAQSSVPLHYHENLIIGFVRKGYYQEKVSKRLFNYSNECLIIQPAQIEHENYFSASSAQCLNIELTKRKTEQLKEHGIEFKNLVTIKSAFLNNSINKILTESYALDSLSGIIIDSVINEILVHSLRTSDSRFEKRIPYKIGKIKNYLDENYFNVCPLEDLANRAGITAFHLLREFKRCMGCTPGDYIRNKRIEMAIGGLRGQKKTIETIALEHGFSDASHFIRVFKKIVGVTPAQFRKKI